LRYDTSLLSLVTIPLILLSSSSPQGTAKVLELFNYRLKGKVLKVAGLSVKSGHLKTSPKHIFRVKRPTISPDGDSTTLETILEESAENAATLKRFKDTVHEVETGLECGFSVDGFEEFQPADVIECCRVEMKPKPMLAKGSSSTSYGGGSGSSRETVGYGIQNKQQK
jgi:translation initiation factor IF-2